MLALMIAGCAQPTTDRSDAPPAVVIGEPVDTSDMPEVTPVSPPQVTPSPDQNYLWMIAPTGRRHTLAGLSTLAHTQRQDFIEYYDGLGKLTQSIRAHSSPASRDVVTPVEYDARGWQSLTYLPYEAAASDGAFRAAARSEQAEFHRTAADLAHTDFPFAETRYAASPLGETLEVGAAGERWQLASRTPLGGRTVRTRVRTNNENEVRLWQWDVGAGRFAAPAFYHWDRLRVTVTTNEQDQRLEEFRDVDDRVVLRRQSGPDANRRFALEETYFVYDDFGDLRVIVSPKASVAMRSSGQWFIDSQRDPKWVTELEYDGRHRMIERRSPNLAAERYVYDPMNRIALYQDGNLRRDNRWRFTKYDVHGRVVLTGLYADFAGSSRADMQAQLDRFYESPGARPFEIRTADVDGNQGYTNRTFPPHESRELLEVTYYDDYDFNGDGAPDYSAVGLGQATEAPETVALPLGRMTGARERILGSPAAFWLTRVAWYDRNGRTVETYRQSLAPPLALAETWDQSSYDFAGRPTQTRFRHFSEHRSFGIAQGSPTDVTISRRYLYDVGTRLSRAYETIDTDPEVLVAQNRYNGLGTLIERNLHSENGGTTYLQSVDYTRNVRGWPVRFNDPAAIGFSQPGDTGVASADLFGLSLSYDDPGALLGAVPARYDGIPSAVRWSVLPETAPGATTLAPDPETYAYTFAYDGLARLTQSTYRHLSSIGQPLDGDLQFNESLEYDPAGNLIRLSRGGVAGGNAGTGFFYGPIDELDLTYSGDQLRAVDERPRGSSDRGFVDSRTTSGNRGDSEYRFDANGSMSSDSNARIDEIQYSPVGPWTLLRLADGTVAQNVYSGSAEKLLSSILTLGSTTRRYFAGRVIYGDDTVESIRTDEGRLVRRADGHWERQYFLTDHLGSVRVVFAAGSAPDVPRMVAQQHFYPYGLTIDPLSRAYETPGPLLGFAGKEHLRFGGLDWYDFGRRSYDAALGRWTSADPVNRDRNLYAYVGDRPTAAIDPTGADDIPATLPVSGDEIAAYLLDETLPTWWDKLLGIQLDPLMTEEHHLRVWRTVDWALQTALTLPGTDEGWPSVTRAALGVIVNVREGTRLVGDASLPSPSESLILRDAERYLWGRSGVPHFADQLGVPWPMIYFVADFAPQFYDSAKFVLLLTGTESLMRTNPNNPVAARGGVGWFQIGRIDFMMFGDLRQRGGVPTTSGTPVP
ncbi:MAG TPA: DUF6443 domain-containing protein [Steroidobacteraceae bacterium]|nr:DUF6443 domain-containing protein [Steroidobacteraceae bacterium]